MSNLRPESHVAQQIRRDKLRIQNSHEFPNNLEHSHQGGFNLDLLHVRNVRNANMLDEPNLYSSQIPNSFSSRNVNALEYDEAVGAGAGDFGFHSSQKEQLQGDIGNWRNNSNHQQGTDWVVNYGSSSAVDRTNTNTFFNAEPNNVSTSSQSFHHKTHSTFNELTDPQLYQNALQLQDMSSLIHPIWANELQFQYSNPQSLSLSLSSKPNQEVSASIELQSNKNAKSVSRDCGKSPVEENVGILPLKSGSYRNVGPLGPFTGYATILKSSKFLRSAQQLLDEFCCLSGSKFIAKDVCASSTLSVVTLKGSDLGSSSSIFNVSNENTSSDWGTGTGTGIGGSSRMNFQQKKARLLYMQEEVARQYKQYHQQMQMVVSSFESVAGLNSATPYISLALKSISKHFKCLKNSISDQLKLVSEALGEDSSLPSTSTSAKADTNMARLRCLDQSFQNNKSGRGTLEQHVWRPQRGLPERSVAILKAWLFEHFLHPYPTDTDKHMLATQTGLSRNQVSNWFINARVRVWKPMVEEIHMLETNSSTCTKENNVSKNDATCSTSNQPRASKPLSNFGMPSIPENNFQSMELDTSMNIIPNESDGLNGEQWSQEKRSKNMECDMNSSMDGSFMGFVPYRSGGLGSVSLTLGLRHGVEGVQQHQQNLQEEQLRCHLGGHMIHDFVG